MTHGNAQLVAAQIAKADEKPAVADSLAKSQHVDDAISRAYYAMFHAASAVLLAEGITVESHQALKTMFGLHLVRCGNEEIPEREGVKPPSDPTLPLLRSPTNCVRFGVVTGD